MAIFDKLVINNHDNKELIILIKHLHLKINKIMADITQLTEKVDALQVALDAEQEQIAAAIAALNQTIVDLQALVADGGTPEQRQALADKLDAIKTDLEGTV